MINQNSPQQSWLKILHTQLEQRQTERLQKKVENLNQFFFFFEDHMEGFEQPTIC